MRILRSGLILLALATAHPASAESLSGAYLSAVQAEMRNDHAAAADYYTRALAGDPGNDLLMQRALGALVAKGDFAAALPIARKVLDLAPANQMAGLVMLSDALRSGKYDVAKTYLSDEDYGFNPLLSGLLQGWAEVGIGDVSEAEKVFDGLKGNDTLELFGQYHKALMYALAGDFQRAETLLATGAKGEPLRLNGGSFVAHVQILAQLERRDDAIAVADEAIKAGFGDAVVQTMRSALVRGDEVPFDYIASPAEGSADAMLVLADALSREAADQYSLLYARLASHIQPNLDDAKLLSAAILEQQQQYDLASITYGEIAVDSVNHLRAEIGRAGALNASGKNDAASEVLRSLAASQPDSIEVRVALGDTYRGIENYAEADAAYSAAIDLVAEPAQQHWALYYSRGIARERLAKWPEAEADFRFALTLFPDQPLVLNYLGYSLVEKKGDLAEAQAMIEKAVAQRPEDGYITDSLGWVLYRVGKFEEAVKPMERAVELLPVDPVLNDHLGDVLWKVGRKREAEFQWKRALSFGPDEEIAERVRHKLEVGLDVVLAEEAAAPAATADGG